MFAKVLVANRGEIAVRVIRALEELGVASVAVYSELDRDALHVRRADEAYLLGGPTAAESYLNAKRILEVVDESGAEAVHPGYGFLAENAAFARACAEAGVTFIGPPASAIEAMGSKTRARELMQAAGVPIVPGTDEPVADVDGARAAIADGIGYPVAVKAAGGGGGKGFRVAMSEDELQDAFEGAAREGEKFFSDATVYLERYLPDPRHVEVQVLADGHGTTIHLGERDCSIQRRHQKLVEESPAPPWVVDADLRERIGRIAVDAAEAVDYRGAGTVEGLLADGEYYFLEMNTRVQVEHCVTEMTTGVDIVKEGIRAAAGEPLSVGQDDVVLRGHAIECRINAEDAARRFAPAPGRDRRLPRAVGPGRARRLGRRPGQRGLADVRPDGGQADRLGRRPRAGHAADAARAGRVRDRRADDAAALPPRAAGHGAVGARRDLPRPARGRRLAGGRGRPAAGRDRLPRGGRAGGRGARLHRRGVGPALRRQGHRAAVGGRGGQRRRAGRGRDGPAPALAPLRARGGRGRRRRAATRSSRRSRATSSRCSSRPARRSRRAHSSASSRR